MHVHTRLRHVLDGKYVCVHACKRVNGRENSGSIAVVSVYTRSTGIGDMT